jgi:SAM-dependent MidA family methyltransferase
LAAAPSNAAFICNELLDAFPVHRVQREAGAWQECYVTCDESQSLALTPGPLSSSALQAELSHEIPDAAQGHFVDVNLEMLAWLRALSSVPFTGAVLILDYGMTEAGWFSADRPQGTLRRYLRHQCDGHFLEDLGKADLTSHVQFTRLSREALSLGLGILEFIEQGRFLTKMAAHRLANGTKAPGPEWIRQFQTLTHPNHIGMSFHALVLGKGLETISGWGAGEGSAAKRRLGL